jgi:hypothetical protein
MFDTMNSTKYFILMCLIPLCVLGVLEGITVYLNSISSEHDPHSDNYTGFQGSYLTSGAAFQNHSDLGYLPLGPRRYQSKKYFEGKLIYDVSYGIADSGFRITPGKMNHGGNAPKTVLFLGGSFIYGEGVNDAETIPAYFQAAMFNQVAGVNCALHGWGPHQMLRILEKDLATQHLKDTTPLAVVYLALASHVDRATGDTPWDLTGPKYELTHTESGGTHLKYMGPFNSPQKIAMLNWLSKSALINFLYAKFKTLQMQYRSDADYLLYANIVRQSARLVKEKYNAPFVVFIWPDGPFSQNAVAQSLLQQGLIVYDLGEALNGSKWDQYIIKGDGHPTAIANKEIGIFIASKLKSMLSMNGKHK